MKSVTAEATYGSSSSSYKGAWLRDSVGWWYCNADKSYTVNNWQYIDDRWYFLMPPDTW